MFSKIFYFIIFVFLLNSPKAFPSDDTDFPSNKCKTAVSSSESKKRIQKPTVELSSILALPLESLNIPTRTCNALKKSNINLLGDLVQKTEEELLNVPGLGRKNIDKIKAILLKVNLQLGMIIDVWPPDSEKSKAPVKELIFQGEGIPEVPVSIESHPVLAFSIQSINFPTRLYNFLKYNKIKHVGDLVQLSEGELLSDQIFGKKSLVAIKAVLSQLGLQLGMIVINWPPDSEKLEMLAKELSSNVELMPAFVLAPIISVESHPILALPIEHLVLSTDTHKILENDPEVVHLGDLVQMIDADLLIMPNFGKKGLEEIKEMLSTIGLQLRMSVVNWPLEPEKLKNLEEQAKQIYYVSLDRPLLTSREEKILRMLFGIGKEKRHTVREVGYAFKLPEVRVEQIQMNALKKLYPLAQQTLGMDAITTPLDPKYVVEELLKKLDAIKEQTPAPPFSTKKE